MAEDQVDPLDEREDAIAEVARKRIVETLDRDGELEQLAKVLANEDVRDFLWRILSTCGMYQEGYDRNFGDMARLAGRRGIGVWILAEICEADPSAEMKMREKSILQAHARQQQERAKRARSGRST